MILLAPYQAEDALFKAGLTVEIKQVNDYYNGTCSVSVSFNGEQVEAVREIGSFEYSGTWDDDTHVIPFIKTKMEVE